MSRARAAQHPEGATLLSDSFDELLDFDSVQDAILTSLWWLVRLPGIILGAIVPGRWLDGAATELVVGLVVWTGVFLGIRTLLGGEGGTG